MDLDQFDLPRYLSMLPLFHDMDPAELQRLTQGCKLRRLGRGDPVFHIGEPCNEFHVTVTGQVKLFAISPAGQEKIIEIVGPGNSFGEALMFTNRPYFINAQALTDTVVLSVAKATLLEEIGRDTRFCMRMLAGLSRRLHGLVSDVQAYALHSGVERVIGYLMRDLPDDVKSGTDGAGDAAERPQRVVLPVSKAAIASRLSMTPEYFSRVLHELEAKGLIEMDKREIRIPDPQRLIRFPLA
ncbi:Crp/Fnr family transcriptional regulator [Hydrogenophaga sp. PAMC20947]|uniref:Crp/Fnr family transcriptional regulator n=1 Tax=Hydrogenophaga sp. PAMC20947 TaxID=2565558 RepID=UPI00109DB17B|nr:Crp/Fnr family transcriptional regulator [Hydrogenophaga sp. PAMC20947]QCB46216.1 Crp/Fnr family transcriptional regulator [Hydrogenophaga sp. PAMC20947]